MHARLIVRLLLLVLALAAMACAEDSPADSPTAPTPPPLTTTPRANLVAWGNYRYADCVSVGSGSCTFVAALRNIGAGCAIRVEGAVRFFTPFGFQVGGTYRFVLPPQQVVQVGEQVPYFVPLVPLVTIQTATDYTVTPVWIDTPCQ